MGRSVAFASFIFAVALGVLFLGAKSLAQTPPASPSPAGAEPPEVTFSLPIFSWAAKDGGVAANWPEGLFFAGLGLIGAAVTLYLFVGELLPSMGGKAELLVAQKDLADFKKRRTNAMTERQACLESKPPCAPELLAGLESLYDDYATEVARLEERISSERKSLLRQAVPLYLLLGGFFAAAFAVNALQALIFGFGWTAIAERVGLKRQQDELQEVRRQEADQLEQEALAQRQRAKELEEKLGLAKQDIQAIMKSLDEIDAPKDAGGQGNV